MDAARRSPGPAAAAVPEPPEAIDEVAPPSGVPAAVPLKLLWFNPDSVEQLRAQPDWQLLLAKRELELLEQGYDEDEPADEKRRAKREVLDVLARGTPTAAEAIATIWSEAQRSGQLDAPLVLLEGQLALAFDELETLKATAAVAAPFAGSDEPLKEAVDAVNELLSSPSLTRAPGVAQKLTEQLRGAFAKANRSLPAYFLDQHVARILVEERHYLQRTLYGKKWLRALLRRREKDAGVPTYLPAELRDELPLFQHFGARLLAEVDVREDQYESHPHALRVIALGRLLR